MKREHKKHAKYTLYKLTAFMFPLLEGLIHEAVSIMTTSRNHLMGYSITGYLRDFVTFCAITTERKLLREMDTRLGRLSRKGNSEDTPMTVTNIAAKAV